MNTKPIEQTLEELKALYEAHALGEIEHIDSPVTCVTDGEDSVLAVGEAVFLAALHNAFPAVLAEIERLRAELARKDEAAKGLRGFCLAECLKFSGIGVHAKDKYYSGKAAAFQSVLNKLATLSPAQPAGSERNWTEDFSHENGNYNCICIECKQMFVGHKRRVVCKSCATKQPTPPAQPEGRELAVGDMVRFKTNNPDIPRHTSKILEIDQMSNSAKLDNESWYCLGALELVPTPPAQEQEGGAA